MKYNAVLRRKTQKLPLASVLELEFSDDQSREERERLAAIELVREAELYIELEPILPEKRHKLEKTE